MSCVGRCVENEDKEAKKEQKQQAEEEVKERRCKVKKEEEM